MGGAEMLGGGGAGMCGKGCGMGRTATGWCSPGAPITAPPLSCEASEETRMKD